MLTLATYATLQSHTALNLSGGGTAPVMLDDANISGEECEGSRSIWNLRNEILKKCADCFLSLNPQGNVPTSLKKGHNYHMATSSLGLAQRQPESLPSVESIPHFQLRWLDSLGTSYHLSCLSATVLAWHALTQDRNF